MSDGTPVRLAAPFEHITVTYPYEWAQGPDCLHVFDEREGTGTVWAPAYARALVAALREADDATRENVPASLTHATEGRDA